MEEAISIKGTSYLAPNNMSRKDQNCKSDHFTQPPPSCCCAVTQSCPSLCDPVDCSTAASPSFTIYLPELAQTHVPWACDAIQPSHPLSSPYLPALNLSQCQGLFQWVDSSHQVANELELQFQHQSSQWIFMVDFLYDWQVWSPCSPRDSQESSSNQNHNEVPLHASQDGCYPKVYKQ